MEAREESRTALLCPAPSASFFWLPQKSTFIKLASIRAAEKVEEKSFGSSHVMQVIYADDVGRAQTVYLQCKVRPVEGTVGRGFRSPPSPSVGHIRYFKLCVSKCSGVSCSDAWSMLAMGLHM